MQEHERKHLWVSKAIGRDEHPRLLTDTKVDFLWRLVSLELLRDTWTLGMIADIMSGLTENRVRWTGSQLWPYRHDGGLWDGKTSRTI